MNYVRTQFGDIHMDDIPIVTQQTVDSKINTALVFFSIVIILIVLYIYFTDCKPIVHGPELIIVEGLSNKVLITQKASSISCTIADDTPLENIVLITSDSNVIDIDILKNKFVTIVKHNDIVVYGLDFKKELDIKEIILISSDDPDQYIKHVSIDLVGNTGKVWEYAAFLPYLRENSISISKEVIKPVEMPIEMLGDAYDSGKKTIMNDNLAMTLTENDENYVSY